MDSTLSGLTPLQEKLGPVPLVCAKALEAIKANDTTDAQKSAA
jgi:hypothetical protein